jgi:uncharacterized membrane protein
LTLALLPIIAEVLGAGLFLAVPAIFNSAVLLLLFNSRVNERVTKQTRIARVPEAVSKT